MNTFDPQGAAVRITDFIRDTFRAAGFSSALIALSGGIDSAVSCALAVRALGAENVYPLFLPYGSLSRQGVLDAAQVVAALGIPREQVTEIDIQPLADPFCALDPSMDHLRKGNIMARVRMIVVFDQARRRGALVVGTENKTEHLLGYYTRFGDEASDVEPLRNLYKTHIFRLAEHLSLPDSILTKRPSAGLWEDQTDEGEFGFTYADADRILEGLFDQGLTSDQLIAQGMDPETVSKVAAWAQRNDFKHHLPVIISG